MRARISAVLPVSQLSHKAFVRLEREANESSDNEFSEVLEDFISTNFEFDAKIATLADRKYTELQ